MLILVVGSGGYGKPFESFGDITFDVNDVFKADAIVFTGGADVSPEIYGQKKNPLTQSLPHRDFDEAALFTFAKLRGLPLFGICRGAQFLCVMSGGELHQHVYNHSDGHLHSITTDATASMEVTSTHHQMMDLDNLEEGADFALLAWAEGLSTDNVKEPEVVEFYDSMSLAVQYHPEYMSEDSDGWKYYQELVHDHLMGYSEKYSEDQLKCLEVDHQVEEMLAVGSLL